MNENVNIDEHQNYPDSGQTINVPTMKVLPLKKICMTIGELPTSYLETMTYYEMLIWFINYLRDNIIPTVNGNAEAVEEVQNVVMALQTYINNFKDSIDEDVEGLEEYMNNYFDNLDVQEEINNKLDDMLEAGTLQEIITTYIQSNVTWTFDTVADMKLATNLVNGSYAKTLGYRNVDDGGMSQYKIRTKTIDDTTNEMNLIALYDNTLVAELITNNKVDIKQMGAYGDGVHDDTTSLLGLFALDINEYIISKGEYILDDNINISSNSTIRFLDGAKIVRKPTDATHYYMFNMVNKENITIIDGHLIGDKNTHTGATGEYGYLYNMMFVRNVKLLNCIGELAWGDGFYIGNEWYEERIIPIENIQLINCQALQCRRNGFAIGSGEHILLQDCYAYKTNGKAPEAGLDIEPEANSQASYTPYINDLRIINFTSEENDEIGINVYGRYKKVKNLVIDGHTAINEKNSARFYLNTETDLNESNVIYRNAYIKDNSGDAIYVQRVTSPAFLTIQNVVCEGKRSSNGGACVQLYGVNGGNSLENIIIDNVTYIKNSDYNYNYIINQQHHFDGNTLNIRVKNLTKIPNSPKICFYDGITGVTFENCDIQNENTYMGGVQLGVYDLFTRYVNTGLSSATLMSVTNTIPDGIYEVLFTNNQNLRSGITFNSAYTTYYEGVVINNTIDCTRPTSYARFQKIGTKIIILNTDFNTTPSA